MRPAGRWALAGAVMGALTAAVTFAPAQWLGSAVRQASQGRVLLSEVQGTVWAGQARVILTGGPGSREALSLPGRMDWQLGWSLAGARPAAQLTLRHSVVMPNDVRLRLEPGIGSFSVALTTPVSEGTPLLQWPAAWLGALGTPWNTVQPSGVLRLSSPGVRLHWVQGRARLEGSLLLEAADMGSRLSPQRRLGTYHVLVTGAGVGTPGTQGDAAQLRLSTVDGDLQLSATGQWTGQRFRLRGEARAAPGQETALQNLLNIMGPRDGARSILSIG